MTSCLRVLIAILLTLAAAGTAVAADNADLFARKNLVAWCIVPFDAKKRTPEQRAEMLQRIGVRRFAYDWRNEHLPTFDAELVELKKRDIELTAVWFPESLDAAAQVLLDGLRKHQLKTQLWVSSGVGDVQAGVGRIKPIARAADQLGCTVALYNHGGWFGEPEHQIAIIDGLKADGITNVGIVYNLHHGHAHLDRFPALLAKMKPHLLCLNLNGMVAGGDAVGKKILPIAQGDRDLGLLKTIRDSGYAGPVGVLNHTDEDAEARLLDNIDGLEWLVSQLDGEPPVTDKPQPRSWKEPAPAGKQEGAASLDAQFGTALAGPMHADGKPAFRGGSTFTVECRAMLRSKANYNILVASEPKASPLHWELFTTVGDGKLAAYLPGFEPEHVRSDVDISDGAWHRVAATFEPGRVRLYVDGKLAADKPVKQKSTASPPPPLAGFALCTLVEGSIGCDGLLDDVRISKGVRAVKPDAPAQPLQRDAETIELFDFEDLSASSAAATDYWSVEDAAARAALPPFKTIPAARDAELTPAAGWPAAADYANWSRSHGNDAGDRYAPLAQITRENVKSLAVAWTYRSGDGAANVQCNPVVVDDVLYAPTAGNHVVAIDGSTGKEIWRFNPGNNARPAHRGLTYHRRSAAPDGSSLLFAAGPNLWSLDPRTGAPHSAFGQNGKVPIPQGCVVAPAVYQNVIVFAGWTGDVFGHDLDTGKPLWTFRTVTRDDEPYADTWDKSGDGANCWGGMALDAARGIAYVTTGSPKPNFAGVTHHGDNLFANCVIALDAVTGTRLWHFQEIRHDIWDLDLPAPPVLVTVTRDGRKVDAVAAVTKIGNTLLLDRVTGKPLFDFRLRRAPASTLRGERTAAYQPDVQLPEPFARQTFTKADVTDVSPQARRFVLGKLAGAKFGWFEPFDEGRPLALYGIHGGAEWTGACFDPATGLLYVSSNELPWTPAVHRSEKPAVDETTLPKTAGRVVYEANCMACHGPSREGLAVNPSLLGVGERLKDGDVLKLIETGRGLMPSAAHLTPQERTDLIAYVFDRDRPSPSVPPRRPERPAYRDAGYPKLLDHEGYPGCKPPWGLLNAIDLNTGKLAWRVPLGEYEELTKRGVPKTGTENFGGATVTAGGLVFVAGTRDLKIRAFDKSTGEELWSHALPFGGFAPPSVYQAHGKQYVVIAATGGGKLNTPAGDAYVAFALP